MAGGTAQGSCNRKAAAGVCARSEAGEVPCVSTRQAAAGDLEL